jgi:hypothetical protein
VCGAHDHINSYTWSGAECVVADGETDPSVWNTRDGSSGGGFACFTRSGEIVVRDSTGCGFAFTCSYLYLVCSAHLVGNEVVLDSPPEFYWTTARLLGLMQGVVCGG